MAQPPPLTKPAPLPVLARILRLIPRDEADPHSVPTCWEYQVVRRLSTGRLGICVAPPDRSPTDRDVIFEIGPDELVQIYASAQEAGIVPSEAVTPSGRLRFIKDV